MSGFSGINKFGSLTTQNGVKVDYKTLVEKYDENKDGKLSAGEFETALKEEKLDKIVLSSVNTNGDDEISEEEMLVYEQKYQMQEAVNAMNAQITKDFSGTKSQYIAQVTLELTNYITDFAEKYLKENTDVSGMADAFKTALPTKYTEIRKNVLANDPSTFKSRVLDDILNNIYGSEASVTTRVDDGGGTISETAQKKIAVAVETEANKYIKANPKCTESELKAHLEAFLNQTDADKMKSAAETFKANAGSFGTYIDGDELVQLKEYAKDFLTEAVNNGVTVKLGSRNIATTNAITTALKSYTDGATLKADMETAIAGLSTVSKKETLIAQDKTEQVEAAEKNFTNIKGSAYQINAGLIDYSKVDARYFNGNRIHERGKGWSGSKDKAYDEGLNILTSDNLKSQYKSQIESMLKEQGISFDKIETIFENVYNQSAQDVLNAEGMITGRGARGLSSKGHAYIDVKTMLDNFATTFNTNIAKAIDEMNASNKDMDTIDLDYTVAGEDDNGNAITEQGNDLSQLYASGKEITVKGKGSDYYTNLAERMVNQMAKQMRAKAEAMCEANGIEFDETVFNTMFNNAKSIAVNTGVTGSGGKSDNGWCYAGAAAGGVGAFASAAGTAYFVAGVTWEIPAVGWAVAGASAIAGTVLGLLGKGKSSSCTLNTKLLLDTFTENFKTNYTNWVETEANKTKNKQ